MRSILTPGITVLLVVVICIVLPATLITSQTPTLEPIHRRKRLQFWSALLSGIPMISILIWDSLGIPPSHGGLLVGLLFALAISMPMVGMGVVHCLFRRGATEIVFIFLAFVVLVVAQIASPVGATLLDIYSQKVLLVAFPLEPSSCDDASVQPIFAHISDLHITDRKRTRDGKDPGNGRLTSVLKRINERKPSFLLISGDITDEGTASQWRLVDGLMQSLDSKTKIIISTGNHDLNYFFGKDPDENPWTWFGLKPLVGIEAEPRIFRAAEFQARHLAEVRTSSGTSLRDITLDVPTESTLDHFQRQIGECALSCVANASGEKPGDVKLEIAGCRGFCAHDLDSIRFHYFHDLSESFPLLYIDEVSHTAMISMTTSMADSAEAGRNAIGLSGPEQIKALQVILAKLPNSVKNIVLVQHHPLLWSGVPPFPHFQWSEFLHPLRTWDKFYSSAWFLAVFLHNDINEGHRIYTLLEDELAKRPGASALVVFGHRHERSLGRIGAITFEEAPNLATTKHGDYGFYLVGTKANSLSVSWCQVSGE
jgi:hypothetical protein